MLSLLFPNFLFVDGRTYESQSHVRNCLELEIIELAMVAYIRAF